jgi:hypothetical protein
MDDEPNAPRLDDVTRGVLVECDREDSSARRVDDDGLSCRVVANHDDLLTAEHDER